MNQDTITKTMAGTEGTVSLPSESSAGSRFSISDIFKNIQQKLQETKAPETDDRNSSTTTMLDSAQATDPVSEQPVSVTSVSVSGPNNSQSVSELCLENVDTSVSESVSVSSTAHDHYDDTDSGAVVSHPVSDSDGAVMSGSVSGATNGEAIVDELPQEQSPANHPEQATTAETITCPEQQSDVDMSAGTSMETVGCDTACGFIMVKQEKEDSGYELFCHNSGTDLQLHTEVDGVKEEPRFGPGMVKVETLDVGEDGSGGDVEFRGVSYRDPDNADSEGDSDSDTSSLSSFAVEEAPEIETENVRTSVRTKGEVLPEELPPLENLHISLPEETRLELLGVVTATVSVLAVVESTVDLEKYSPVNDETVLFYENRQPLGVVFEVFGQCKAPSYSVRFNSEKDMKERGIEVGLKVFFVPEPVPEVGEITHFVFIQKLKQFKGSDASWKGNNEPPDTFVEYSDDEEEKRSKAKRKGKAREETADPKKRMTGEEKMGPGKKRRVPQAHGDASSGSAHGRFSRYLDINDETFTPQSSGFRRGRGGGYFGFRRDGTSSNPTLPAPAGNSPLRPPGPWGRPPLTPSPNSPFLRSGPPESSWTRGDYSGGGAFGSAQSPPPVSSPGRGPFSGSRPFRPPFSDNPGPFGARESDRPAASQASFWRPSPSSSPFSVDTSLPPPPPNLHAFSSPPSGQHGPAPPPAPWVPSPPPPFSRAPPTSQSGGSNGGGGEFGQPFRFAQGWGGSVRGFGSRGPAPARFQGGPQFEQYHQGQTWQQP
ncbi:uncharacterized protein LOC143293128 isoform X2 [Babylonia areolata]|uniref:uncharacterized protein LOC143293128 isoform X2 n=1 Tax=Babylonia areolata TaxID=304850 RepID=UPI003FD397AB